VDRHCISKSPLRKRDSACIICGHFDLDQIERHLIGGVEVRLCRQCYREMIERTKPPPCPIWTPPDDLETIACALLAEADLLSMMAQSRWVFAHALIERVRKEAPDQTD
jgi:hypothetical protein